ncbi:MAG: PspA/IM30 family protein [Eubacterium sp.]|nr:PspA/IM30 family protein [Eubacterium sp.]
MAGILKRFKDIMAANINALLDKAEDPEKMIDQYLRDMESDLGKIKAETAAVMAEAEKAKRELTAVDDEIAKMQAYAEKALVAGNEDDARRFLAKKAELTMERELKQQMADVTGANAQKMRAMHDKLTTDIATLNERKATIKAKVQAAKAQEHINDLSEQVGNIDITDGMSAFDKMEAKADQMLDMANARAELNSKTPETEALDEVAKKYEDNTDIDNELAALKSQLGL